MTTVDAAAGEPRRLAADLASSLEAAPFRSAERDGTRDAWPTGYKLATAAAPAPLLAVEPGSTAEVAGILRWAAEHGHAVTPHGARSNVVGALEGGPGIALSLERMDRVLDLDEVSQIVTVEAGANGGDVERHLNERGFTLGQYPQSLHISTIGGWLNTRATGTHSALYGGIERAVCGLTAVLPSGEVVRIAPRARPAGGLDLIGLVCGSEGSLCVITEVALAVHRVLAETTMCLAVPSLVEGLAMQRELVQRGHVLGLLRLFNAAESRHIDAEVFAGDERCLLMVTARGPDALLERHRETVAHLADEFGATALPDDLAAGWLARRYECDTLMADANAEPGRMFDTIEVSLPWRSAAACAQELEAVLGRVSDPYHQHFSHVYDVGVCLYMMLHLSAADDTEVLAVWRETWQTALDVVTRHGGTLGHHHGIGSVRRREYQASPEGRVHRAVKDALDPDGVLYSRMLGADPSPGR